MYKYLPDYRAKSIFNLDYEKLKSIGIKGIFIDVDNTLVPMHTKNPTKQSIKWVKDIINMGFKVCVLSNASNNRAKLFMEKLGIDGVGFAFKPRIKGYIKASEILKLELSECVMIGDQIFTDIKGGKKAGVKTILTEVLDANEHWYVKLKRKVEKLVIKDQLEMVEKI